MDLSIEDTFYLERWLVEPPINRISRDGEMRQLDPRTMQVLVCLAERPGEVIKRKDLMDRVWKDVIVNENTLSSVIARLRKLLGDDRQNPQFIETISKSGYRLIASVHTDHPESTSYLQGDELPIVTISQPHMAPGESKVIEDQIKPSKFAVKVTSVLVIVALLLIGLWLWQPFTTGTQPPLDPQPLLTLPGPVPSAAISPNGHQVAFMWRGPDQDNWDVYLKLVGGDQPVRFTSAPEPEAFPTWSPDGQYVAYIRANPTDITCTIFKKPAIGGNELRVGECEPGINSMRWSPNGKYIVMNALDSLTNTRVIKVLDIEKQQHIQLTFPENASQGDKDPVFSPDNEQIAFRRRRNTGNYDLFVVSANGGPPRKVLFDKQSTVSGVDWTPDGRHLLFSSNRDGDYRLWKTPVGGGTPERVNLNDHGITTLSLAHSTERLMYRTTRDETDFWIMGLHHDHSVTSPPAPLFPSTREELFPQFSPVGDRIAFTSKRSGYYEIWSGKQDGTELIRHTDFQSPLVGPARWSPDGQELVFDASPEGHADLYLVPVDSKLPQRLTSSPYNEANGRFSRDGQFIYFSSNQSGQREIWKIDRNGKYPRQITNTSGIEAQESHNGRELYFTRADTTGLWKMPVQGGDPVLVLSELNPWDWGNWQVVEDGIYFAQSSTRAIAYYAFSSGSITPIYKPERTISFIGPALTVSPDEQSILFARIERSDDEVMFVDL